MQYILRPDFKPSMLYRTHYDAHTPMNTVPGA